MKYAVSDSLVITKRQLLQLIRVPEVLIFSTIQPVMFVLLFRYVFGGSISTGIPGVDYVQLLMPGIFVQTVAFTLAGTAGRRVGQFGEVMSQIWNVKWRIV